MFELKAERVAFVRALSAAVDAKRSGPFSGLFDLFSSSDNVYRGQVDSRGFEIRRKRTWTDRQQNYAVARGSFHQEGSVLRVRGETNGFTKLLIPYYTLLPLFYLAFFFIPRLAGGAPAHDAFVFPFITVHAAFMFGLPYLFMRRSVTRMRRELEREFYYIARPMPSMRDEAAAIRYLFDSLLVYLPAGQRPRRRGCRVELRCPCFF